MHCSIFVEVCERPGRGMDRSVGAQVPPPGARRTPANVRGLDMADGDGGSCENGEPAHLEVRRVLTCRTRSIDCSTQGGPGAVSVGWRMKTCTAFRAPLYHCNLYSLSYGGGYCSSSKRLAYIRRGPGETAVETPPYLRTANILAVCC